MSLINKFFSLLGFFVYYIYCRNRKLLYIIYSQDIGSAIFPLTFTEELKKEHKKEIKVVTIKKYKEITQFWAAVDYITVLPKLFIRGLERYLDKHKYLSRKNIYSFYTNTDRIQICNWVYKNDELFYNNTIQNVLYSYNFDLPLLKKISYGNCTICNQNKINEIIKTYNIEKNKSVILIMKSASGDDFPISFWKELIKKIQETGKKVYVNGFGIDESLFDNITLLKIPLHYMPAICIYAGYAITVQTGLGDLLHVCKVPCSMILNYGKKYFRMSMPSDIFDESKSCLELYNELPIVEKNRYNKILINQDPFIFDNSYADIFDSENKINSLIEILINDIMNKR